MTDLNESAHNCLLLVERIAEKYGCPEAQKRTARAEPMTARDWQRLARQGITVGRNMLATPTLYKKQRSIFDARKNNGRPINPKIKAATLAALKHIRNHNGQPPHGSLKLLAKQHGVNYGSLMTRLHAERRAA